MGSSRDIAIGPVAVVSLLLGTMLQKEIDPKTHREEYERLAFTATFFAGATQFILGFFRYGQWSDYKPANKMLKTVLTRNCAYIVSYSSGWVS